LLGAHKPAASVRVAIAAPLLTPSHLIRNRWDRDTCARPVRPDRPATIINRFTILSIHPTEEREKERERAAAVAARSIPLRVAPAPSPPPPAALSPARPQPAALLVAAFFRPPATGSSPPIHYSSARCPSGERLDRGAQARGSGASSVLAKVAAISSEIVGVTRKPRRRDAFMG
jgi:hypothetical protein